MRVSDEEKVLLETLRGEKLARDAKRVQDGAIDVNEIKPGMDPSRRTALAAELKKAFEGLA